MTCPRCGAENPAAARFCMACGAALETAPPGEDAGKGGAGADPETAPPPAETPPPRPSPLPAQFSPLRAAPSELPATHPEWRMSPAGPLPDPPKRRIWLWVLGAVGAILLFCVLLTIVTSVTMGPALEGPPVGP